MASERERSSSSNRRQAGQAAHQVLVHNSIISRQWYMATMEIS